MSVLFSMIKSVTMATLINSFYAADVCEPLSFETCREFVTEFERLYEGRDLSEYAHSNPMRKHSDLVLDTSSANDAFFSSVQFVVGYNFAQHDNSGVVSRTFEEQSFHGSENLHDRIFTLVSPSTNKAIGAVDCTESLPHLTMQDYDLSRRLQQFKLNENDQLKSVECSGKVLTAIGDDPDNFECLDGVGLFLDDPRADDNAQQWRIYNNGIVNVACGRENGNLAITNIDDDIFEGIARLDHIQFSIVNPYNGFAVGVYVSYSSFVISV